ncbi:MAG TPA: efflux RND transporter periplasmic adaptor subunit [Alphaproteobacteria bacterium]|nr:efflux RND transporter periplasmic adaptor subunit [Alphaproteobacteria bacterium]
MAHPKKRLIVLPVVLIAAAGGYFYFDHWRDGRTSAGEITLYGNVDIREADLAFNVAGRVKTMQVEEGDRVKKGQLLATLDPDTYQAQVDAAKAQVAAQKATLDRLLAGSRPEEIKEARANVQAIQANLEDARINLKRAEELTKTQVAAQQRLDQSRANVKSLEAQLDAAKQRLALAIQGPRKEDIAQARAMLQAQQAQLALAQSQLAYTKLFAPDDGVVKTRIVEPGAVVQPQAPVYTVALSNPVWVRTYIPEPDLGKVRPGMKAQVYTDSEPNQAHSGWIGFISPVAEFTPKSVETQDVRTSLVYRLRVYVNDPDNTLRQGMPATVKLKPGSEGGAAGQPPSQ